MKGINSPWSLWVRVYITWLWILNRVQKVTSEREQSLFQIQKLGFSIKFSITVARGKSGGPLGLKNSSVIAVLCPHSIAMGKRATECTGKPWFTKVTGTIIR